MPQEVVNSEWAFAIRVTEYVGKVPYLSCLSRFMEFIQPEVTGMHRTTTECKVEYLIFTAIHGNPTQ